MKDLEGHDRIVDLMLSRALAQTRNRREHLVIDLERPSVNVGDDEANQIVEVCDRRCGRSSLRLADSQWDLIVVSTDVKGSPAISASRTTCRSVSS